MTGDKEKNIAYKLNPVKIIIPVAIGLAVVAWLMIKEIDAAAISHIKFTWLTVFWLGVAFIFVVLRTFFYMWRIKALCDNDITWRQSFRIIMLWEFTSAISPSTVGGTALAVVFINKEGITVGRSTTIVLMTSFLDELYFVVIFPLLLPFTTATALFTSSGTGSGSAILNNLLPLAIIGYIIIFIWVVIVGYGLFINPLDIKKLLITFFNISFLKRWKSGAEKAGDDIIQSSLELKSKPCSYWLNALMTTFFSWTFRYLVINAIIMSLFVFSDHLLLFTRQLVLWIMMIISPTPGGSGFAEIILGNYISDLIPTGKEVAKSLSLTMAIIWRAISYYPFLVAGAIIVPSWIQKKFLPSIIKKE